MDGLYKKISKYFLVFICLFVLPSFAFADTVIDASLPSNGNDTSTNLGYSSAGVYVNYAGFSYRPNASHNICSVQVKAIAVGVPTDFVGLDVSEGNSDDFAFPHTGSPRGGLSSMRTSTQFGDLDNPHAGHYVASSIDHNATLDTSNYVVMTFNFTPCIVVVGGNYYQFTFYRYPTPAVNDSSNKIELYVGDAGSTQGTGSIYWDTQFTAVANWKHGCSSYTSCVDYNPPLIPYIVLNGTENFSANSPNQSFGSSTNLGSGCTDTTGLLAGICHLFLPAANIFTDHLNQLYGLILTVPPFSYFSNVATVFSEWNGGFSDASASSSSISLPFSALGATASVTVDTNSIAAYPPVSFMRTILGYLVYAGFGFMAIKYIGNII